MPVILLKCELHLMIFETSTPVWNWSPSLCIVSLFLRPSSNRRPDKNVGCKGSSIDLPSIAASIYDAELANRLRTFLVACPPSSPSAPVAELMIATADFQRDLASWGVRAQKGGVDAKDLFHLYVVLWIQDKRLHLLDFCKFDKVTLMVLFLCLLSLVPTTLENYE
jgi:hypothetical protein